MTHRKELESLKARLEGGGAKVYFYHDADGYIEHIAVDAIGFGTYPMAPISFAERAREYLADMGSK
jgi:hypothetical protein